MEVSAAAYFYECSVLAGGNRSMPLPPSTHSLDNDSGMQNCGGDTGSWILIPGKSFLLLRVSFPGIRLVHSWEYTSHIPTSNSWELVPHSRECGVSFLGICN